MKILIVGDVHFNCISPSSRIDDYGQAILNKVDFVLQYATDNKIKNVFFLGDIFHQTRQTTVYLNQVISMFQKHKENGISMYSLVGNHDVSYGRLDFITSSPLGTLFFSKLLEPIGFINLDGTSIVGVDYGLPVPISPSGKSILLAHMYYEQSFGKEIDCLWEKQISPLGYDMICLGHDHSAYPPVKVGTTRIFRFGAISRGTSHRHHLLRNIQVLQVETTTLRTSLIDVPHAPSERVFSVSAVEKYSQEEKKTFVGFRDSLQSLVKMMGKSEENTDVWSKLEQICKEEEVYSVVREYLQEQGV